MIFFTPASPSLAGTPDVSSSNTYSGSDIEYAEIAFALTGSVTTESYRVLTDEEIATLSPTTTWDIAASDWQYIVVALAGAWTDSASLGLTITTDATKWFYRRFAS